MLGFFTSSPDFLVEAFWYKPNQITIISLDSTTVLLLDVAILKITPPFGSLRI